ncbi:MAG: hypothetical protein CL398_07760 [Acidiferrobacteraceae bacterium]|nr:hypothetical protein [Acidiferrobacteraceae bacterium]
MRLPAINKPESIVSASEKDTTSNQRRYCLGEHDLPLYCPNKDTMLWSAHPRVYLAIELDNEVVCPYCGTIYVLSDAKD